MPVTPLSASSATPELEPDWAHLNDVCLRFAHTACRNPHDAQEVAQEALMKLFRLRSRAHPVRSWPGLARTTVWTTAIDQARPGRNEVVTGEIEAPAGPASDPGSAPEQQHEQAEAERRLADLLTGLRDEARQAACRPMVCEVCAARGRQCPEQDLLQVAVAIMIDLIAARIGDAARWTLDERAGREVLVAAGAPPDLLDLSSTIGTRLARRRLPLCFALAVAAVIDATVPAGGDDHDGLAGRFGAAAVALVSEASGRVRSRGGLSPADAEVVRGWLEQRSGR